MFDKLSQFDSAVIWAEHGPFLLVFIPLFMAIYFLPTLVAFVLQRENRGKIALANIPAGLSWIAWLGILIWAIKGKQEQEKC